MFSIFPSNKKCRLEHVVNKLMSCLINEFLWILIQTAGNKYQTSLIPHATPWNSIKFYGTSSILQGTAWNSMEVPRISMEVHGFPWSSMEFDGGISHGSHRFPWPLMTALHRHKMQH